MDRYASKAWAKNEMTKGKIVSIDAVKNEIVIKQDASGSDKTFKVEPGEIALLKVGETVKIKTRPGSDVAQSVKLIAAKKK